MTKVNQKNYIPLNEIFFENAEKENENEIIKKETKKESLHDFIPNSFNEYIGQKNLKERLFVYMASAKKREQTLDHILLFGPPGLGKTTLATIIAKEMNVNIKITSGPVLQKSGDLVAILSNLKSNDIFFIDEIHRLPITVEETLYSAMEQFKIDIIIGEGPSARTISLPVPKFTLIGATTKTGLLSAPLRSRFGITEKFDWYEVNELSKIIEQTVNFFSIKIDNNSALKIASLSRGTPRIAKKLTRRIVDYSIVNLKKEININLVKEAMNFFGIIDEGLTITDLKILKILFDRPNNTPIGIDAISSIIGEEVETIEDVYEPFLMQKGFVERTPRGRILSISKRLETADLLNNFKI